MKLSDITVFKHYQWPFPPPFQTIIEPSLKTKSFLIKLLKDDYFQSKVIELRQKYQIPQQGYKAELLRKYKEPSAHFDDEKYNGNYDIQPLREKMEEDIENLVGHYNLHWDYNWLFFLLITHNAFIEKDIKDFINIKYYSGIDYIQSILKYAQEPISAILIESKVTKEQLKDWIDENWETLEIDMQYKMPNIPNEKGTYKNVEIDAEIANLKENGLTYKEISEKLSIKYPDNDNVYALEWLKGRYSRYKRKKVK